MHKKLKNIIMTRIFDKKFLIDIDIGKLRESILDFNYKKELSEDEQDQKENIFYAVIFKMQKFQNQVLRNQQKLKNLQTFNSELFQFKVKLLKGSYCIACDSHFVSFFNSVNSFLYFDRKIATDFIK